MLQRKLMSATCHLWMIFNEFCCKLSRVTTPKSKLKLSGLFSLLWKFLTKKKSVSFWCKILHPLQIYTVDVSSAEAIKGKLVSGVYYTQRHRKVDACEKIQNLFCLVLFRVKLKIWTRRPRSTQGNRITWTYGGWLQIIVTSSFDIDIDSILYILSEFQVLHETYSSE